MTSRLLSHRRRLLRKAQDRHPLDRQKAELRRQIARQRQIRVLTKQLETATLRADAGAWVLLDSLRARHAALFAASARPAAVGE